MILDAEVEPSKSIDPASEESAILGSKAKKTGGKKSKFTLALPAPSIETQPIPASKKDTNNMYAYEKMVKKSTKILDEKKKRYPENNSPIP